MLVSVELNDGGEGGIRTPDRLAPMPHFECGTFNHSATSPCAMEPKPCFWKNAVSIGCAAISMRRGAIQGALHVPQEIVKTGLDHGAHAGQKTAPGFGEDTPRPASSQRFCGKPLTLCRTML